MNSAPSSAQCALHPGTPASFVCGRCGNFMCSPCGADGREAQCPTCRALSAAPFPYDASADFGTLWAHALATLQREALMLLAATVAFMCVVLGGATVANVASGLVNGLLGFGAASGNPLGNLPALVGGLAVSQLLGTLVNIAAQGVAMVGYYRVLVDALEGRRADLSRLFSQLHLFVPYVGLQGILFCAVTVPMVLLFGGALLLALSLAGLSLTDLDGLRPERLLHPALFAVLGLAVMAVMVGVLALLPVTLFSVPELVVGQCGPVEALRRSWRLGAGQRARLFGYSAVAGLVLMAGVLLCCVGVVPALPLATLLLLALFLALRRSSGLPPDRG